MEVTSLGSISNGYQQPISNNNQDYAKASQTNDSAEASSINDKYQAVKSKDPQAELEETKEKLDEAVAKLNKTAGAFGRALEFKVHDETNRMMVSVVDTENDKVIRQYPSEEVLDMAAKVDNYLGLIFDKKA